MFYVIYFAVIAFALYLIFHDRPKEPTRREPQRPQAPQVPQVPQTPARPKPAEPEVRPEAMPRPRVVEPVAARPAVATVDPFAAKRELSWTYLDALEMDEELDGDSLETEITGMRYYCTLADLGPVNGYVKPEPENPHDPEAQVVIRADGKKLGYIPREALEEYGEFNPEGLVCPFAGVVKVTRQGYLWADILVALPAGREFVEEELTDYLELEQ
jgi:hypothetical protein